MDEEERLRMAESGVDSDEYRRFLEVCQVPINKVTEILFSLKNPLKDNLFFFFPFFVATVRKYG